MLQNAYILAKIGADTAEIEQLFAEKLRALQQPERLRRSPPGDSNKSGAYYRERTDGGVWSEKFVFPGLKKKWEINLHISEN